MLKINHFFLLLVLAVILAECAAPREIPPNYLTNPRTMAKMTNGCWIYVNQGILTEGNLSVEVSGELIAVQNDTFYILTKTSFVVVPANEIKIATMFLFKNQSGNYLLATGLGLLPNIAGIFISNPVSLLGIPFAIVGITTAAIENSANTLRFPKKNLLNEFNKFARFPQGLPSGVGMKDLTLK